MSDDENNHNNLDSLKELASAAIGPLDLVDNPLFSLLLFEASPDAIVAINPAGTILLVNTAAEELLGAARSELIGRPVIDIIPERYRARHLEQQERYFADPKLRNFEGLWARKIDGSEVAVSIRLAPVVIETVAYVIAFIRVRNDADD